MDFIVYLIVRATFFLLSLLPHEVAVSLLSGIVRGLLLFLPKYKKIAYTNLEIAFPGSDVAFKDNIVKQTCVFIARLLLDFNRLDSLSEAWVKENVSFENDELKEKLLAAQKDSGILFASGHLGSFEI